MRDEDILSALRVAAKADAAAIDPALERLARGEATPEERARLEAEAERSEAAAAMLEAFRPLDPLARARMKKAVRRTRGSRRGKALVAGLLAVACAAAIIVARPSAPALPAYALEMSAGDRLERGSDGAKATVVSPGSRLELVARPADSAGPVAAVLIVRSAAGTLRRPLEVSTDGAVRAQGRVSELAPGASGSVEFLIAVGRGPDVESFDGRDAHGDGRSERLVWWTRTIEIAGP